MGTSKPKQSTDRGGERRRRRGPQAGVQLAVASAPAVSQLVSHAVAAPHVDGPLDGVVLTAEQRRSRQARNIAIAVVLGALAVLFYAVTIVKLGPGVLDRPL